MLRAPGYRTFHQLGLEAMPYVETFATLEQVGMVTGRTRQNTWHDCAVVLGKFIWHLRVACGVDPALPFGN